MKQFSRCNPGCICNGRSAFLTLADTGSFGDAAEALEEAGIVTHAARSLSPAGRMFLKELDAQAKLLAPSIGGTPTQGDLL